MVNWALVFFLAGTPQDYRIHAGYNQQENCQKAQERYREIFVTTGSKMTAECRPRNQVQTGRPTSVVHSRYTLAN